MNEHDKIADLWVEGKAESSWGLLLSAGGFEATGESAGEEPGGGEEQGASEDAQDVTETDAAGEKRTAYGPKHVRAEEEIARDGALDATQVTTRIAVGVDPVSPVVPDVVAGVLVDDLFEGRARVGTQVAQTDEVDAQFPGEGRYPRAYMHRRCERGTEPSGGGCGYQL